MKNSNRIKRSTCLTALAMTFICQASLQGQTSPSTTQFEQPSFYPLPGWMWGSRTDGNMTLQTFDDFSFSEDTLLTEFHWYAASWDSGLAEDHPVVAAEYEKIVVSIWSDDDGKPGEEIYSATRTSEDMTTVELPLLDVPWKRAWVPLSRYEFTFPQPLAIEAGRRYWISPLQHSEHLRPGMAWLSGRGEADPNRELSLVGISSLNSWQREIENGAVIWSEITHTNRNMLLKGRPANDSDEDGMDNAWESAHGLNPVENDAAEDPDQDGATNLQEYERLSDPHDPDTDDDGLLDGVETILHRYLDAGDTGTDPLNPDTDGDGLADSLEIPGENGSGTDPNLADTDGDHYHDALEIESGHDPTASADFPQPVILEGLLGNGLVDSDTKLEFSDALSITRVRNAFDGEIGKSGADMIMSDSSWANWFQATLDAPVTLTHFTISSARDKPESDPQVWDLQGSNDGGETFTSIFKWEDWSAEGALWKERGQVIRFDGGIHFSTPAAYSTYRLWWSAQRVRLGELELFGSDYQLEITNIRLSEDDKQAILQWHSLPDKTYSIDASEDLKTWIELTDGHSSEGRLTTFTTEKPDEFEGTATYYRVREEE